MPQVFIGAVLVIAGIAAFIEASSHSPVAAKTCGLAEGCTPHGALGLSKTAYDLLRIGAWALVIVGGLLVVMGMIRYWQTGRREP